MRSYSTPRLLLTIALTGVAAACGGLGDGPAAGAATVACTPDATVAETGAVETRRDGVHFVIDNQTAADRIVYVRSGDDFRNFRVPPGSSTFVATQAPGSWAIVCAGADGYPAEGAPWESLRVHDSDDVWVAHDLPCDHPTSLHPDYVEYFEGRLPTGTKGDPLAIAAAEVPHWFESRSDDEVRVAGYPDSSPRVFHVVRDGTTVAVADYRDDGQGGWFFGSVSYCDGES